MPERKKEDAKRKSGADVSLVNKKLLMDKIGYGFGATQFVNILFFITGASFFLVGLLSSLRSAFTALVSSFLTEYSKKREIPKKVIATSGLLFGFSFLFLAAASSIGSTWLFAISVLIGAVGVVAYGDFFIGFVKKNIRSDKIMFISPKYAFFGLIVTAISMLISGYLLDLFPITGKAVVISILGKQIALNVLGYLLVFEIAAIMFITAAYFVFKLKVEGTGSIRDFFSFVWDYSEQVMIKRKKFMGNKYLLILTVAMIFIASFQGLVNAYMGVHIFSAYRHTWLSGFMNVALVYAVALLFSLSGPLLSAKLNKYLGLAPMLVFGAILLAFFPFIAVFNPYFPALLLGGVFSILGGAVIGSAHNLLAGKILNEEDKNDYYVVSGLMAIVPFLVITIGASYFANLYGILYLFKYLSFAIVAVMVPIYLVLVFWSQKQGF